MQSNRTLALVLVAGLSLAACSGGTMGANSDQGSSSSAIPSAGTSQGAVKRAAPSINADAGPLADIVAIGSQVKAYEDDQPSGTNSTARHSHFADGVCDNGFEFWSPDIAGTPNSTESRYFYDAACTQLARDVVRVFTPTAPGSETVQRTATDYAFNNSAHISVHNTTQNYTNGNFDSFGFPIFSTGYDLESSSIVTIGSTKKTSSNLEVVMEATKGGNVNNYCSDGAGYDIKGLPGLDKASGNQAGDLSGDASVTVNGDGSVTWSGTKTGAVYTAPLGGLSVLTGTFNTACPIATPAYTLSGGTFVGSFTLPVTATYSRGLIIDLTVSDGARASGNTINVTTNTTLPPTSPFFINGTITNPYSVQVSTFAVNALGNGMATVTSDGDQYVITNWTLIGKR